MLRADGGSAAGLIRYRVIGGIALALCLLLLPWVTTKAGNPALITLATRIVIYAIAASSLNLILGYGGLVSFGHAAYFGVGAYAVGMLYFHFSNAEPFLGLFPGTNQLLIAIPIAVVTSAIFALVVGALSLRTTGLQFIMITLAFAQMVFFLFVSLKYYGGDDGLIVRRRNVLFNLDMADDTTFYFVCLAIAAIYIFLFWRLAESQVWFGARRHPPERAPARGDRHFDLPLQTCGIRDRRRWRRLGRRPDGQLRQIRQSGPVALVAIR